MDGLFGAIWFYIVFSAFGFVGFALAIRFSKKHITLAYIIAKPLGLLIVAYPAWLLASLKVIKFNSQISLYILVLIIAVLSYISLRRFLKKNTDTKARLISPSFIRKVILIEFFTFVTYIAYLFFRNYNSQVTVNNEQMMDYFLFISSGKTDYFPFFDGWLSSKPVNYYYYGYYIFAFLTRISNSSFAYAFNFSLGIIVSQTAIIGAAIVYRFSKSISFSVVGAYLLTLAGNIHFTHCYVDNFRNSLAEKCSYIVATKFNDPDAVITDFSAFSFVKGDFHPQVISIPFFLLNIYLLVEFFNQKKTNLYLIMALLVTLSGSLMINTWDFITLGLIFALIVTQKIWQNRKLYSLPSLKKKAKEFIKSSKQLILVSIALCVSPFLLFLPFFLQFKSPVMGLASVQEFTSKLSIPATEYFWPSKPQFYLEIWGAYFLITGLAIIFLVVKKQFEKKLFLILSFLAITTVLIIFTERFFFLDLFHFVNPPLFRANTVFKFYYHGWMLMGLSTAITLAAAWRSIKLTKNGKGKVLGQFAIYSVCVVLVAATIIFPIAGYHQRYVSRTSLDSFIAASLGLIDNDEERVKTLDSTKFLQSGLFIDDYNTIQWLNAHQKERTVILEAVGGSYYLNGRIAIFTGMGNPLNWEFHEWTWRFDYPSDVNSWRDIINQDVNAIDFGQKEIKKIGDEVQEIYETDSSTRALELLQKYNVEFVYIGGFERNYRKLNAEKFKEIGTIAYQTGSSTLLKIDFHK
jgi:uncharacterized membrane protein